MEIEEFFIIEGGEKEKKQSLGELFGESPFSIMDARKKEWQDRKRWWRALGIQSAEGRSIQHQYGFGNRAQFRGISDVSIFDPHLAEVVYKFFCPAGGKILDPFAGGSVRGIVANYLGFRYTGVDIRPEQIASDLEQARKIVPDKMPEYICGDSLVELDRLQRQTFDLVFTCPPYGDLEVYSQLEGDISNMPYDAFLESYKEIIRKACDKLKTGAFAVFVVGEFRDKKGNYVGFVPDTVAAFREAGMAYYNEMILVQPIVSAALRAKAPFVKSRKITKTHQNVLVFKKGQI